MRAALLARVSDESQAESDRHSLPAQLRAMHERCAREDSNAGSNLNPKPWLYLTSELTGKVG